MAVSAPTVLTSNQNTSNLSAYPTASVSPASGSLVVVSFVGTVTSPAAVPAPSSVASTISGITLTQRSDLQFSTVATPSRRSWIYTGQGHSGGSGTITFNFGSSLTGATWFVLQVASGFNSTTPVVANPTSAVDSANAAAALTFSSPASAGNLFIASLAKSGTQVVVAEGGSWTGFTNVTMATPNQNHNVEYQASPSDLTAGFTWTSTVQDVGMNGIEIAETAGAATFSVVSKMSERQTPRRRSLQRSVI